MTMKVDK